MSRIAWDSGAEFLVVVFSSAVEPWPLTRNKKPETRNSGSQYFTIAVNDFGSSEAPPTSAPSISSSDISALALSGLTEPP